MPVVQVLVVVDEFEFEFEDHEIEGRWEALTALEDVVVSFHEATECCVTMTGRKLILWNPEIHWADQSSRPAGDTIVETVTLATAWLADYLKVPRDQIEQPLDLDLFE